MTERHSLQPAYVLHLQPYRESSALLNLFTRDQGRVAIVARGVRRSRSSSRVLLQAFTPLLVSWSSRGELGTLTGVERGSALSPLAGQALISGLYLNELVMRLTHRFDPHPELFACYAQAIGSLAGVSAGAGTAIEDGLRQFEKHLLQELGYGLLLERDARSAQLVRPEALYRYHIQHGPVLHQPGQGQDGDSQGVPVHGRTLLALLNGSALGEQERAEAKRLMRAEIDSHLGGRPLASRRMFNTRRSGPRRSS